MAWTKEQEQAIHISGTNSIISAGAGSGKTAVLTARTLQILKNGIHINELLILTFTNAAAREMKERIRNSLKKEIMENESLKEELELLDQSYITTFDSFALSIVKKYHYLLNIDREITITDSSIIEIQKKKIMNEVFEDLYKKQEENFQKLILAFCMKEDKDLIQSLIKIANKIEAIPNGEEYLESYIEKYFNEDYLKELSNEYEKILLDKLEELKDQKKELSYYVDHYMDKLESKIGCLCNSTSLEEIKRNMYIDRLPNLPSESSEEAKEAKTKLKAIIEDIKSTIEMYGTKEEAVERIKKTKGYTFTIIAIIKDYEKRLNSFKRENAIYDFLDIARMATLVLKENDEVREELKQTFKEIMIDEYQDTNDLQENFISYIENNNVYVVGDIKQSIYRFRNANPSFFKKKYDTYAKKQNGIKIDLVKNFRSRKEVLENINEIFNLIMDNGMGGAEYQESHQMIFGNTDYLNEGNTDYNYKMRILEYDLKETTFSKEEIEIFTIAKDIKDKINNKFLVFDKEQKILRPIQYNDMVILMDRTTSFDLYKKIFEYLKIPLMLYKEDKMNDKEDIYIIRNCITLLLKIKESSLDEEFKYAFVSLARSFLYALNDQEIFDIIKNKSYKESKIYQDFYSIKNKINSTSISIIIEEIIRITNFYEKLITVGNIKESINRIEKILDMANNLESIGYDIYDFNVYLKELQDSEYEMKYSATKMQQNAVHIMTIHKSKGLEFPICYYSGLYKAFNISDIKEQFLFDANYGILTPFIENGIAETITKYLVKQHYKEEEIAEKIRLFYVALTRAKEQMILIAPKEEAKDILKEENQTIRYSIRRKYNSFSSILNSVKKEILSYYETIDLSKLELSKEYLYNKKELNKLEIKDINKIIVNELPFIETEIIEKKHYSKEENKLINQETYKNIELGLKFHEILEHIDFTNPQLEEIENNFIKERVKGFLNSILLENKEKATLYKEYEFIYEENNKEYHGIIDLMLEYNTHIDIIDYKLNNLKEKSYIDQLNGYKKYIEKITNKKTNLYLYSILTGVIERIE